MNGVILVLGFRFLVSIVTNYFLHSTLHLCINSQGLLNFACPHYVYSEAAVRVLDKCLVYDEIQVCQSFSCHILNATRHLLTEVTSSILTRV